MKTLIIAGLLFGVTSLATAGNFDAFATGFANGLRRSLEARQGYQSPDPQEAPQAPALQPAAPQMPTASSPYCIDTGTFANCVYSTLSFCQQTAQNFGGLCYRNPDFR